MNWNTSLYKNNDKYIVWCRSKMSMTVKIQMKILKKLMMGHFDAMQQTILGCTHTLV